MVIKAIKAVAFARRAKKEFTAAVNNINGNEIYPGELAQHVQKLNPDIRLRSFPIVAQPTTFKAAQVQRSLRQAARDLRSIIGTRHAGAVVGLGKRGYAGYMQPLTEPDLFAAGKHIAIYPELFGGEENFKHATSFSHIVLLTSNGKAIVFIPSFQKSTEYNNKAGRKVDIWTDEGTGRHYLHLQIGQLIVNKMRAKGINAELHVPAPEHIHLAAPPRDNNAEVGVHKRITAPLEILDRHYDRGAVKIAGREIHTINLSQPKNREGKAQG